MIKEIEITDHGLLNHFLRIKVDQISEKIFYCLQKYAEGLLKKFMLENNNLVTTPLQVNEKLCKDDENEKVDERIYEA